MLRKPGATACSQNKKARKAKPDIQCNCAYQRKTPILMIKDVSGTRCSPIRVSSTTVGKRKRVLGTGHNNLVVTKNCRNLRLTEGEQRRTHKTQVHRPVRKSPKYSESRSKSIKPQQVSRAYLRQIQFETQRCATRIQFEKYRNTAVVEGQNGTEAGPTA